MPKLSLDIPPYFEFTESGLMLLKDNISLSYNKIQDTMNALDSNNIKNGSITAAKIASEAWIPYAPAVSNFGVGAGSIYGEYQRFGRTVHARAGAAFGAGFVIFGRMGLSVPFSASGSWNKMFGVGWMVNGGVREYQATVRFNGADYLEWVNADSGGTGVVDALNPFAWGPGDEFKFSITYEAAA